MQAALPTVSAGFTTALVLVALWGYAWKAVALWMAARRDHTVWYVVLVVLNTAGILEIIYIFAVARRHPDIVGRALASGP